MVSAPDGRAKIMSRAMMRMMVPPAALRAARETPSWPSNGWPNSTKANKINVAMPAARSAISRRSGRDSLGVRAANSTAVSIGEMMVKKVVKAVRANSSMAKGGAGCAEEHAAPSSGQPVAQLRRKCRNEQLSWDPPTPKRICRKSVGLAPASLQT
jgi:hypothetical protein